MSDINSPGDAASLQNYTTIIPSYWGPVGWAEFQRTAKFRACLRDMTEMFPAAGQTYKEDIVVNLGSTYGMPGTAAGTPSSWPYLWVPDSPQGAQNVLNIDHWRYKAFAVLGSLQQLTPFQLIQQYAPKTAYANSIEFDSYMSAILAAASVSGFYIQTDFMAGLSSISEPAFLLAFAGFASKLDWGRCPEDERFIIASPDVIRKAQFCWKFASADFPGAANTLNNPSGYAGQAGGFNWLMSNNLPQVTFSGSTYTLNFAFHRTAAAYGFPKVTLPGFSDGPVMTSFAPADSHFAASIVVSGMTYGCASWPNDGSHNLQVVPFLSDAQPAYLSNITNL